MAYCSNCGNYINDNVLFCPKCGKRVAVIVNIQQQQVPLLNYSHDKRPPLKPNSNVALALLSTILCCFPIGIYAVVLANKVDTLYYLGEYQKAEYTAEDAKKWAIIGIVCGTIAQIALLIFYLTLIILTDGEILD